MRSADPGTDTSRWLAYIATLMRELRCEGAALDRVRDAMRARHTAGLLWNFVEEGTAETLDTLKQAGYRIGVVSNADGRVASFLEQTGLIAYFETVVDSGIFGVEKPDARIFLHACESMGVEPASTYYVGDIYEVDVVGARAAGLRPVLIADGDPGSYDCPVITTLTELPRLIAADLNEHVR